MASIMDGQEGTNVNASEMRRTRMRQHGLTNPRFRTPEEAVRWLGAVQAQEFPVAKWSLGQRCAGATEVDVAKAVDDGRILRLHVLRPTWHFVARDDLRLMLAATANRVHQLNAFMYRQCELDDEVLAEAMAVLERTLADGRHRSRSEIGHALADSGISASGTRLGYILQFAELEGLICSGAVQGKQQTYALVRHRAPDAVEMAPESALADLARRYFTGHGPATARDLAGWASLTLADTHRAIEANRDRLARLDCDGKTFWFASDLEVPAPADTPVAHLIQGYDEYVMGYFETRSLIRPEGGLVNPFLHLVLIDGVVAGSWKRSVKRTEVVVEVRPGRSYATADWDAVERAAADLGAFYGLPALVVRR